MTSYVPRGYVTTPDAVDRVFRARHPELAASTLARSAEMRRLYSPISGLTRYHPAARLSNPDGSTFRPEQPVVTIGKEDLARIQELDGIASEQRRLQSDAAIELRTALAEGDLVAVLNYEEMPQVERFRWREDDGLAIVLKGRLSNQVGGTLTQFRECAVVVSEADLAEWLRSILQTAAKRGGGRPSKYDWEPVLAKLRNRLADDGAPAFGDGGQAKLERFVADQFPTDDCPSESVIRFKVQEEIRLFRQSLSQG